VAKNPIFKKNKNSQKTQDTTKKEPAKTLTPIGKTEDFYNFSNDPAKAGQQVNPAPESKKLIPKLDSPVVPVAKKQVQAPPVTTVPVIKAESNDNYSLEESEANNAAEESVVLKDPFSYKFFNDTIRKGLDISHLSSYLQASEEEESLESNTLYSPSVFSGHELQLRNNDPIKISKQEDPGVVFAFMAVLGLFSVVRVSYYKKATQYFKAVFDFRLNVRLLREEKSVNDQLFILLLFAGIITSSTFLNEIFKFYKINPAIPLLDFEGFLFLKITALVAATLLGKIVLVKITGLIFKKSSLVSDYIFNQILFFNLLNIVLFPLCVISAFNHQISPEYVFAAGGLLALLTQLFMIRRLLTLGNSEAGTSFYYLFLYLCTLEILPVLVLIKLFSASIG
jgi:hypothetical protein